MIQTCFYFLVNLLENCIKRIFWCYRDWKSDYVNSSNVRLKHSFSLVFIFILMIYQPVIANQLMTNDMAVKNEIIDTVHSSFLDSGRRWNIGTHSVNDWPIDPYDRWKTTYYTITNDTTFNNTKYKIVYEQFELSEEDKFLRYYIREDSAGKVFHSDGEQEVLAFDFSLNKGDTAIVEVLNLETKYFIRVDSVGTVTLADNKDYYALFVRVCDYFKNKPDCDNEVSDIWVPGIGSLNYGISYPLLFVTGSAAKPYLLCHNLYNDVIYVNPEFGNCELNTSAEHIKKQEQLVIVHQESGNRLKLEISANNYGVFKLYDLFGRKVGEIRTDSNTETFVTPGGGLFIYYYESDNGKIQTGKVIVR